LFPAAPAAAAATRIAAASASPSPNERRALAAATAAAAAAVATGPERGLPRGASVRVLRPGVGVRAELLLLLSGDDGRDAPPAPLLLLLLLGFAAGLSAIAGSAAVAAAAPRDGVSGLGAFMLVLRDSVPVCEPPLLLIALDSVLTPGAPVAAGGLGEGPATPASDSDSTRAGRPGAALAARLLLLLAAEALAATAPPDAAAVGIEKGKEVGTPPPPSPLTEAREPALPPRGVCGGGCAPRTLPL